LKIIKGINHVGVVVNDIDDVIGFLGETFRAEEITWVEFPETQSIYEAVDPHLPKMPVEKYSRFFYRISHILWYLLRFKEFSLLLLVVRKTSSGRLSNTVCILQS
jgi:hypothetical protein